MISSVKISILSMAILASIGLAPRAASGDDECQAMEGAAHRQILLKKNEQDDHYRLIVRDRRDGNARERGLSNDLTCTFADVDPGAVADCREINTGHCVVVVRMAEAISFRLLDACVPDRVLFEESQDRSVPFKDPSVPDDLLPMR